MGVETQSVLRVNLGERGYDIVVTSAAADGVGPFVRSRARGTTGFLVTDDNAQVHALVVADSLTRSGIRVDTLVLRAGETQKSLHVAMKLYDRLAELQANRKTLVVAVGGGVMGDLAGFVAATYMRGLPLFMVPTTLLAMVDSSVGGKVAVNHPKGKNLIGAFHQPLGVWIDIATLGTLPDREYRSGMAEVVKYGVILDAEFFAFLEANADALLHRDAEVVQRVVARCCRLKADVVEKDEREEAGLRAILNYGHTFAHAFETVSGYGTWLHGEAVAAGMMCASRLALRLGLSFPDLTDRQGRLLTRFGLPTSPNRWPIEELLAAMRRDKKSVAGQLRFVLPVRLGEVRLDEEVSEFDVRRVLVEALN